MKRTIANIVEPKITAANFASIVESSAWSLPFDPLIGPMNILSSNLRGLERRDPTRITNIRRGDNLVIASDYGGDHKRSRFRAYSFLLANLDALDRWNRARRLFRLRHLRDGRRMSFTRLGDLKRRKALPEFLNIADTIPGILISVLVDRRIGSIFSKTADRDLPWIASLRTAGWSTSGLERLFTIVHFASFSSPVFLDLDRMYCG